MANKLLDRFLNAVSSTCLHLAEGVAYIGAFTPFADRVPRIRKYVPKPTESDEEALRSDWEAVGDDIRSAMNRYEREQKLCTNESASV